MHNGERSTPSASAPSASSEPGPLRQALRQARIALAERSAVVVDLRDAELARLELLDEALAPVFAEVPAGIDLFDRGISRGDTPRLWIDAVAHVAMGRDKRRYRFVLDTRFGRKVLAESNDMPDIVPAVTRYVASRLVERERALAGTGLESGDGALAAGRREWARETARRRSNWRAFLLGVAAGALALFAVLWIAAAWTS